MALPRESSSGGGIGAGVGKAAEWVAFVDDLDVGVKIDGCTGVWCPCDTDVWLSLGWEEGSYFVVPAIPPMALLRL